MTRVVVYEVDGACGVEPLVFRKEKEPHVQSFHWHETRNVVARFLRFTSVKYRFFQITKCRSDGPELAFPVNEDAQEDAIVNYPWRNESSEVRISKLLHDRDRQKESYWYINRLQCQNRFEGHSAVKSRTTAHT